MRKITTSLLVLALALVTVSFTSASSSEEGKESATIVWTGKKVTGSHTGTIDFKSFDWQFDKAGTLTSANFVVDMTSMTCTDLDAEGGAKLIGHLNSPDFFSVAEHGTATFTTTEVKSLGKGNYAITGDLTIKGITKSLSFDAMVENDGHMKHATAQVSIDRTAYDIKYGSGSFFDNLGDKAINDEFELAVDIKKH